MLPLYKPFEAAGGAKRYLKERLDKKSPFGYGLTRRITMVLSVFDRHHLSGDIVDFGCGDSMMLDAVADHLESRCTSGLGVDVFPMGVPADQPHRKMRFRRIDLSTEYPFQIDDESFDVAIASAFLKHHPEPARFLAEVYRILRAGGHLVLLDPRPLVVNIGMRFGRFGANSNPSVWSKRTIEALISDRQLGFWIQDYERYWIAPNHRLFELGLETLFPDWIKKVAGLHQCLLLQRRR
jgi:SAM-dependent methyltransferase